VRQQWRGGRGAVVAEAARGAGGGAAKWRGAEAARAGKNEKEPPEPSLKGVGAKICGADLSAEIFGVDPRATSAPQKHHVSHLGAN
jgi:hypothetical protein